MKRWASEGLESAPGLLAILALAAIGVFDGHIGLFGWLPATRAVLLVLGAVFLLIEAVLFRYSRRRLRRLEDEQPRLRQRAELGEGVPLRLMRNELSALADLAHHLSTERISLYRHESDGFTLVARYSAVPPFNESLGREVLPFGKGAIGQAWENLSASRTDLPHPGPNNGPPTKAWLRAQERHFQIKPEVAAALTMRSQSYTAFRLSDADGQGEGVTVFESTNTALGGAGQGLLMEEAELEPLINAAGPRLIELLKLSQVLHRKEIRAWLDAKQGPGRHDGAG